MMPRRWFFVAYVVVFFTGIGLLVVNVAFGPDDTSGFATRLRAIDPGIVEVGLSIAALLGLVLGMLAVSPYARHDQRLAVVRERVPRAYVFQARKDVGTQKFLSWALNNRGLRLKMQFTVSVDHEGLTVWTGSRVPVNEGQLSWTNIEAIGMATIPRSRLPDVYPGLELVVNNFYQPARSQVIGIEAKPKNIQMATIGAEADVVAALAAIRSVIGQAPVAAPQTVQSLMPVDLRWGTAYAKQRRAFLPLTATMGFAFPLIFTGIATILTTDDPSFGIVSVVIGVVLTVAAITMFASVARATARERIAGYTTLNAANLDLDQRHPRTGMVVRPAYAPALTKHEFADALRRGMR